MTFCLPAWYPLILRLDEIKNISFASGCPTVGGNVRCLPESLRAAAEVKLRTSGYWPANRTLSLETYTLARYITSEVGSGTPSDRVAVGEAAVNRAKLWELGSVNNLLLYRQRRSHPNYGFYGPIHDTPAGCAARGRKKYCSPYGRWAATSRDPTLANLVAADLILSGKTGDFAKGADDQVGIEHRSAFPNPTKTIRNRAAVGNYWVGPLPGVNHWHTFLFRDYGYAPSSAEGQRLIRQADAALARRARPDWSGLTVCGDAPPPPRAPRPNVAAGAVGLLAIGGLIAFAIRRAGSPFA